MHPRVRALYKIEPQAQGPAEARRIIAEELSTRVPAPVIDDVKLMVSELVTNGIVHGSRQDDDPVMLDLIVNGGLVRCRVLDHGQRGFASRARPERSGGRLGASDRRGTVGPVGHAKFATANRSMVRTRVRVS